MKLAHYRLTESNGSTKSAIPPDTSWAQFGDEVLLYAREAESAKLAVTGRRGARRLREQQMPLKKEQMHVVVQNGRMFQQEHPKVPVLLDKGRYLLVKLAPQQAEQLKDASPTCYGVFPLEENQVVFDVREAAAARVGKIAWIEKLVKKLKRTSLEPSLKKLVSFPTRHSTSNDFKLAATWARDQLKALSYTTSSQNVTVLGSLSRNIIADKKGLAAGPRKVVLVTAHLDSINIAGGPTAPAPGADDNGSGSAGVLEMARVFSEHRSEHDLRFILFGGEEEGLFGSKRYVATLSATEKQRILSVVNMDMVGTLNTITQSVLLEGAPLSQRVIDGLNQAAATYTALKVETSLNPFASDHVPFINANIPAVLTIEGADNTNSNIHSDRDTINHINYDFALEILRMNVAFVASEIGKTA
jgi:hypothetical protein